MESRERAHYSREVAESYSLGRAKARADTRALMACPPPRARTLYGRLATRSAVPASDRAAALRAYVADDEYVDVDGVVRPKGLGVHNSLINWTNKAVPLGQTV